MKQILAATVVVLVLAAGIVLYLRPKQQPEDSSVSGDDFSSIAVLPFDNLTNDASQNYFSDGLTEGILNSLAKLKGLKVSSRNSSFKFRGKNVDIKEIGKQLSVRTILEGSYQVQGERIRITAQLINVADGFHFWSEQFDENSEDVFALEDKVATAIAERLRLTLLSTDDRSIRPAVHKQAYDLYLKGRLALSLGTLPDFKNAIALFESSIQADSMYARAYAGLADAYNSLAYGSFIPPNEAFPKAKMAALKAIQIDPSLAEPHASLGFIKFYYDWDWQLAEQEFRTSIALNPNYALVYQWYGYYLTAMQRYEEAMAAFQKASLLDPLSVAINTDIGFTLYYSGKYDKAISTLVKSIEMNPRSVLAHIWLGRCYQEQAKYKDAIGEYNKSLEVATDWPVALAAIGNVYGVSGDHTSAEKSIQNLQILSSKKFVTPYGIALVYAGINDKVHTLEWLNKAYAEKSHWLVWLKTDPRWNRMRKEKEFTGLVHQVGLPRATSGNE